jgi:integrase
LNHAKVQRASPSAREFAPLTLKRNPHDGNLFVFRGRRADLLKIIWHDGQGAWEDFDLAARQWRIPVTKSGKPRHVPLSTGALHLLASVPRREDCPWTFANPKTGKPYVSFFISWNTARRKAGLADVGSTICATRSLRSW